MGAYLKVCEGGAYSKIQYFVFFTAALKEYTGNKCPYKQVSMQTYLIILVVKYTPHNKICP